MNGSNTNRRRGVIYTQKVIQARIKKQTGDSALVQSKATKAIYIIIHAFGKSMS
jgi:hypothetical protein